MGTVEFFIESLPNLLQGLEKTLTLTFSSIVLGFIMGILLALGRVYGNKISSWLCIGYIELIRGTPLLVQVFILYYGIPTLGYNPTPLMAAFIGFSLNSAAYQAEYLRGSIQAISSGQMIAARSMGMSKIQAIKNIILPQSLRIAIPAWSNEVIYLLKYTSIAYIIQVKELTAEGRFIAADTFRYIEIFSFIGIIYLFFTVVLSEILDNIEKRVKVPGIGAIEGEREV
ncbi:MAG: amino acid ABC transporter permease [Euryarchaeota archaeon]|nr:amino acid ABC transporter permease [Euryarchaeota archaeon]